MPNSRRTRSITPVIEVFLEGDDETTYFNKIKQSDMCRTIGVTLKPKNISGGGYTAFLKYIKKYSASIGCMARFLVIDYDRYLNHPDERLPFKELVDYCNRENKTREIPYFLIITNPKIELFICFHISAYRYPEDPDSFLCRQFGYSSIDKFKSEFNSNSQAFQRIIGTDLSAAVRRACVVMSKHPKVISNTMEYSKKNKSVKNKGIIWNTDNDMQKNSNMDDFFKLVDVLSK